MSVATLLASAMIFAMQAQSAVPPSAVPQSALAPGAAAGPMSTSSPHVLFRWTDFKGQINYGDRPPPNAQNVIRIDLMTIGENTQSLLPYLVRRASSNFPVMLFTSKNCPPCVTARSFLNQRGIPFAERTIESADDSMEFKRLTGAEGVPVATLGTKPMIAFDPDEWNNGLDAAGYPQNSQLPRTFQQEPARPLTQKTTATAAKQ
ncbi:MAG: glutaredoxin domain-containing protein [Burkholderiaceae bacterium]